MVFPNLEEVKHTSVVLFPLGETIELRCVGHHHTIGGYYHDQQKLAEDACTLNLDFEPKENVFVCLNPINPQLYGRRPDKFAQVNKGEGVQDSDVICRRWLLIDVDPVRPSGVSATGIQKAAAHAKAKQIFNYLIEDLHLPEPVCADSGNGAHLLLPLANLPNDNETKWACEKLLRYLGDRFNDAEVKVDQTTSNAARICTLYGTVKRKGSDTPEQPHRLSKLLHVPDPLIPATLEQLLVIVGPYPGHQQRTDPEPATGLQPSGWDIEQLLQNRGIEHDRDDNYASERGPATRYVLTICPWNPEHNDRAAYVIQWPDGAVAAGCHHDGCTSKGNDWQTLKKLWGLRAGLGISEADIIFPASQNPPLITSQPPQICKLASTAIDWPVIRSEAFHGPLGELVFDFARDTEATAESMLFALLLYFGNAIGRRFYVELDGKHFLEIFVGLIGPTARGRKGTADRNSQNIIDSINPAFALYRHTGLTTGEGMIQTLLDNIEAGVPRPAVFIEPEFSAVMQRKERKGNTLDQYIRQAWDDVPLAVKTRNNPLRVDNAHISLLVHITPAELIRLLPVTDISSGFANRFLWCFSRRKHLLPGACSFTAAKYPKQVEQLRNMYSMLNEKHIAGGGKPIEIPLNAEATAAWSELYGELDPDTDAEGLMVHLAARRVQQVRRVAAIFALADGYFDVGLEHIRAARAVMDYSTDTMDFVYSRPWWGDPSNLHDPAGMAPKLFEALQAGPMQRSDVSIKVFKRNYLAKELNALRDTLVGLGRLRVAQDGPSEIWQLP